MRCRLVVGLLLIGLISFFRPAMAEEPGGWLFDSLTPPAAGPKSDGEQIYEVLLKQIDRWNAHDVDGYLSLYWKSPNLLVVVDSEQYNGWVELHDSYINRYPNRDSMGYITPSRIQIKLLKPDLALALTRWSISFPASKQKIVGNSTMNLERFDDGWKIVASHSSTADM
jgi:ketosteroid isomerase-like protein